MSLYGKICCWLNYHEWDWYSVYDYELFAKGQVTGPLVACLRCGHHTRIEHGRVGHAGGAVRASSIPPRRK